MVRSRCRNREKASQSSPCPSRSSRRRDDRSHPVHLGLDEDHPQVGEPLEHTTEDHLPERPAGKERVLDRQGHERGEAGRVVGGSAGATVLADRQTDVDARRPHRIQRRVEEELPARKERGHHHPAEPVLLGPVDVSHRLVDVVERHEHLAHAPTGSLGAELGEPPVVGDPRLVRELGIGRSTDVFEPTELERQPVREQHLGHHALALVEVAQAVLRVPLALEADLGVEVPRVGDPRLLLRAHPVVEGLEILLLDVVAIARTRRLDVAVHRDDRDSFHGPVLPPNPRDTSVANRPRHGTPGADRPQEGERSRW